MPRKPLPDLIKGIAVIFMIQVHIMELFMLPEVYSSSLGRISLFLGSIPAAPVFMAVMGYFVALSTSSLRRQIWRGIKLIVLGFLLNVGLNAHLLIRVMDGNFEINPFPYIFGVDILFLAGLSLIFISALRYLFKERTWLYVAVTLSIPVIAEFTSYIYAGDGVMKYMMAFIIGNTEWSYFPFFPWAGWVMAGYSFALLEKSYGNKSNFVRVITYLIYISAIPVFVFLPWALEITTNLPVYYHHGIIFFIWGLFFCLIWVIAWKLILDFLPSNLTMKYLKWLGKNVTLAYIVQWLIIGNTATAIFKTQPPPIFWLSVVLVILLTSVFILIVLPFLSSGSKHR